MYEIVKAVVLKGRYELTEMLRKVDILWVQGELTEQQKEELEGLAREHADPAMTATLRKRVEDLEVRVAELEKDGAVPGEEFPAYVEGHVYRNGDRVSFGGKRYVCALPEGVEICVWSPAAYPGYWKEA